MTRITVVVAAATLLIGVVAVDAHKGATSKFTYSEHVYAVFASRCSGCHVDGGVAPMSLLTFQEASPWAEALRVELLAAALDERAHDFVRSAHRDVSARDLDIILDWATGGVPEGDSSKLPQRPPEMPHVWSGGAPDVVIELPVYRLQGASTEGVQEVDLRVEIPGRRRINRFDVLPGTPAIVRSVNPMLRMADGLYPLGTWVPRQRPAPIQLVTPVRIEPGARLSVRVEYKKTWKHEQMTMTDQSRIGLYFAD